MFGPSGFWTMAPLHYTAKFDSFLSLDCTGVEDGEAQGRDQILPSGNLGGERRDGGRDGQKRARKPAEEGEAEATQQAAES